MAEGILPAHEIRQIIDAEILRLDEPPVDGQIQPASLDLRLGSVAYRVRASFLPGSSETVQAKLDALTIHKVDISEGAVLETGCVYVVPLLESLTLPMGLSAAANPKSSTGRLDVFTRVIADGVGAFDQVPEGYQGRLYAEICPQTFSIMVRKGSRLSQLRFRRGSAFSSAMRILLKLHDEQGNWCRPKSLILIMEWRCRLILKVMMTG